MTLQTTAGPSTVRRAGARTDAETTRSRLLDEAELRFARQGIAAVTSREITEAAGQRNTSAISYHFGSREGLLLTVLARRGGPVDHRRGELRAALHGNPSAGELVRCLVEPYAALLGDPAGRSYLRVVAQLRGRFANWRIESDSTTTLHLSRILDELESFGDRSAAQRAERVVAMIMLMTAMTAERARRIDEATPMTLSHAEFVDELVDMCTAVLDG